MMRRVMLYPRGFAPAGTPTASLAGAPVPRSAPPARSLSLARSMFRLGYDPTHVSACSCLDFCSWSGLIGRVLIARGAQACGHADAGGRGAHPPASGDTALEHQATHVRRRKRRSVLLVR